MKRQWYKKMVFIIAVLLTNVVYGQKESLTFNSQVAPENTFDSLWNAPSGKKKPHAFASQTALKQAFDVLWNEEQYLKKIGELGTSSIAGTNFSEKLIFFYQRVFRTIVAEDAKKGSIYTKYLNIQIKKDGHVVARTFPLTLTEATCQCLYLTRLALNPNDQIALTALKNLHAKKIQKKPTDDFFPKIVVIENNSTKDFAYYGAETNTIYIKEQGFSLGEFKTIIHEFTHAKQLWHGFAMGGFRFRALKKSHNMPAEAAEEVEAEKQSLERHPEPQRILERLEETWAESKSAQRMFPYFTKPEKYAFVLKHFGLKGNEPYAGEAKKAYELRKKYLNPLIKKYVKIRNRQKIRVTKWRDYESILNVISAPGTDDASIQRKNMLKNIRAYYPNATLADIHARGCKQYLDIKKKLGLIPA